MDTESALGPYAQHAKTITLGDLVRMHGHACDGLVVAAAAMSVALTELYPDGVIDRTDTGCISNNSPCFGDVAAYLTGARIRFGTQKIEPTRGMSFVVHRFTTGQSIEVELRQGIFPTDLSTLEAKLRSGEFTEAEMRACQQRQWQFAHDLLHHPLAESFRTKRLPRSTWVPDAYPNTGPRGDIVNRAAARR
jgi:formylmethanofuran dehydrogenase subunit E